MKAEWLEMREDQARVCGWVYWLGEGICEGIPGSVEKGRLRVERSIGMRGGAVGWVWDQVV